MKGVLAYLLYPWFKCQINSSHARSERERERERNRERERERDGLRESKVERKKKDGEKIVDIFLHNEIVEDTYTLKTRVCRVNKKNPGTPTRPCSIDLRYITREKSENYVEVLYIVKRDKVWERNKYLCTCVGMRMYMMYMSWRRKEDVIKA